MLILHAQHNDRSRLQQTFPSYSLIPNPQALPINMRDTIGQELHGNESYLLVKHPPPPTATGATSPLSTGPASLIIIQLYYYKQLE